MRGAVGIKRIFIITIIMIIIFQPLRAFRRTVHNEQRRGELL